MSMGIGRLGQLRSAQRFVQLFARFLFKYLRFGIHFHSHTRLDGAREFSELGPIRCMSASAARGVEYGFYFVICQ
jgi:hypothetical protein